MEIGFLPKSIILAPMRIATFAKYYEDSRLEFTEDNTPTALYNIFEEFLMGIPTEDLEMCEVKALFNDALDNRLNKQKIYI